eukprot:4477394-Pleurochrysis_carterae.AAC.1
MLAPLPRDPPPFDISLLLTAVTSPAALKLLPARLSCSQALPCRFALHPSPITAAQRALIPLDYPRS